MLAHEGLWPLRASCPFLHMALSIEPKAACTLNLLVTGSVTQVSLLLPSFPAFVSSHGSSNAKLECLTATAGPGQLPRTTVYLTATGSIFFILFFGRIGMRFGFPMVSTCSHFGSYTLLQVNLRGLINQRAVLQLRQFYCFSALKTRLREFNDSSVIPESLKPIKQFLLGEMAVTVLAWHI